MARLILALLVVFWGVVAAAADYPDGQHKAAQTRFGVLQVTGELGAMRINLNGTDLGVQDWSINIDGVWAVAGEAHDWAVLTVHFGGNACEAPKMILRLDGANVVRTDTFGVCKGRATDLAFEPGAISVTFSDSSPGVSARVFRFDGASLTDTPIAVPVVGDSLSGGQSVARWLTEHPQALIQDPAEQARLRRILTVAQMDDLSRRMSGPGRTQQEGGWVVGRACQAHACGSISAMWAVRISDGRPLVMLFDDIGSESGAPLSQTFGFRDGDWNDPEIRSFLEETLP